MSRVNDVALQAPDVPNLYPFEVLINVDGLTSITLITKVSWFILFDQVLNENLQIADVLGS